MERRRRPWALLLALLQSKALLAPRPNIRGPRPLRSTPADFRSTPADIQPRTENSGSGNKPPKFTPRSFGKDKKYSNPREAHRAAAKMRKDAEAAFLDRPRDAL